MWEVWIIEYDYNTCQALYNAQFEGIKFNDPVVKADIDTDKENTNAGLNTPQQG